MGVAQGDGRQRAGQRGVHLGGGPPQRPGLGDEVLALGQLAQRQLPAVGGALEEGLEHAQHPGPAVQVRHHPPRGRGHPGAALAGQGQRQLQVGIDAGHDPAQHLEDERISVHDRRVRLLGGRQPRHQPGAYVLFRCPLEAQPSDAGPRAQRLQQHLGGAGVVQGVVGRASGRRAPGHVADQRGREPGRQRLAGAYQELVAVAGPLGRGPGGRGLLVGADQDVVEPEAGVGGEQVGGRDQGQAGDRTPFAGEPALPRKPLPQQWFQGRQEIRRARDGAYDGFRHGVASFPRSVGVVTDACPGRNGGNRPARGRGRI